MSPQAYSTFSSLARFAARVGERLAVFLGDDGSELVGVLDEQLAHGEEDVGAKGERRVDAIVERLRAIVTTSSMSSNRGTRDHGD